VKRAEGEKIEKGDGRKGGTVIGGKEGKGRF